MFQIKKYWNKQAKIILIILASCAALIFIYNIIRNIYLPVRITSTRPPASGEIFNDGSAWAFFDFKNYSRQEQKVYFLVYQHNFSTDEDQLFDIENMYLLDTACAEEEIENGVLKIPAGESRHMLIEAKAKDSSKVMSSRGAPNVEVVTLKY